MSIFALLLTQAQMAELFHTTKQNISLHLNNIFSDGDLSADSVVKESLIAAAFGQGDLNIPRYVYTFEPEEETDVAAVQRDIERIEAELVEARTKTAGPRSSSVPSMELGG